MERQNNEIQLEFQMTKGELAEYWLFLNVFSRTGSLWTASWSNFKIRRQWRMMGMLRRAYLIFISLWTRRLGPMPEFREYRWDFG